MTPERERLVRDARTTHQVWQGLFLAEDPMAQVAGERYLQAKRALAAYDAAHPEEAK